MERMSYQEKQSIVSLISTSLIALGYGIYVYHTYQDADLSAANIFKYWGKTILYLIPVLMVFKIVIHIVFTIINKIATNEDEPKFTDELDKLIELKATRNAHYIFILGFFLSILSQVINMPPSALFITLVASMLVSCIMLDVSKLYFYRRGV